MARVDQPKLEAMLAKIMPVLEKAIQGDYSGKINMTEGDDLNELYAGIQVLVDTIREQTTALEEANDRLYDYLSRRHGMHSG